MKRSLVLGSAATLFVAGAVADRALDSSSAQVSAASPTSVSPSTSASTTTSSINQTTESAYKTAAQSVVFVENVGVGSGSGVIYDTTGDIVTNNHVVSGAQTIRVTLNNGQTYKASMVGTDAADDLAVIRIHAAGLKAATFATPGSYRVAETVLAVGSPLGLKQSVTSGLVSGLHRVEQESSGAYLPDAIQTSAPINPGNSGGALVNLNGTVVGIPTLVQTSSQNGTSTQNIGFAVPADRVTLIARQIIATGKVEHTGRAYMGISPADASSTAASPYGFGGQGFGGGNTPTQSGAIVQQLAASGPAAKAGMQQGDVITSLNGRQITRADDLLSALAQQKPGNTIHITVQRNGTAHTLTVHLGELPA